MNKRGLQHFGLDHLTINLGFNPKAEAHQVQSTNIYYLAHFLRHNRLGSADTNVIAPLFFEPFNHQISIRPHKNPNEHPTFKIDWGPHNIMQFEVVDNQSLLKKNLQYKYNYRITFHGRFFALDRIGKLNKEDFFQAFLDDLDNDFTVHSISRADICADISGVSTRSVWRGLRGDKSHRKEHTFIKVDPITNNPQTINYGSKSSTQWHGKIYNKKLEAQSNGKEELYLDYLEKAENVTRLEIMLKSSEIHRFDLNLHNISDLSVLLSVYRQILQNKFNQFQIVDFVAREMTKQGFKPTRIEPLKLNHQRLMLIKVYKRAVRNLTKIIEEYGLPYDELMEHLQTLETCKPKVPFTPPTRLNPNPKP